MLRLIKCSARHVSVCSRSPVGPKLIKDAFVMSFNDPLLKHQRRFNLDYSLVGLDLHERSKLLEGLDSLNLPGRARSV
jgi:hypothetical protein